MNKSKEIIAGGRTSLRFKVDVWPEVMEFVNAQDNFNDVVIYLIEKEIAENGIRNLNRIIPQFRDKYYFTELMNNLKPNYSTLLNNTSAAENNAESLNAGTGDALGEIVVTKDDSVNTIKDELDDVEIPECYK